MARQQMYDFVLGLFGLITDSNGVWYIVGPLVLLNVVVRFIRWSHYTARGETDLDELRGEARERTMALRQNVSNPRPQRRFRR